MSVIRVLKKFRMILSRHQKLRIFELFVLMVIGGVLETLTVSLIVPFMQAVMEPDKVMQNKYVIIFCKIFDLHSARTFLVVLAIILACIYIFKNIFLLFEYNIQRRFVYNNMFSLQKQLLNRMVHRPYEYFLAADSGELVRSISSDAGNSFQLLTELLNMFTEVVVSLFLIIATFMMAPRITIIIAALLIALMMLITLVLKPRLRREGLRNQRSAADMNRWLLQSIQGIKEIKVTRKEGYFQENYDRAGKEYIRSVRRNSVFNCVPRFMIEAISMSAFLIVVALMIYNGEELSNIVPMLSAVAMAAVRLLPSVNRISQSFSAIAFFEPMLDKLIENLQIMKGNDPLSISQQNIVNEPDEVNQKPFPRLSKNLQVDHISYRYPDSEKFVLSDASLKIMPGESVGIVGASGAGKTTLVDIILGLLHPEAGRILVDDVDIRSDIRTWLSQVGYIPQMIFMLSGSIKENIAFGEKPDKVKDEDVWKALREASLEDFVRGLPDQLNTQVGDRGIRISGGQRQRIGIARALYANPEVLIFDEATSALDTETESAIMDSINHLHGRKTMIIIAHRLTTIEGCDHVYRVGDGKITRER